MRGIVLGVTMAAVAWPVAVIAADRGVGTHRSVERIAMGAPARQRPEPAEPAAGQAPASGSLAPRETGFRLHDLSRRWIEFQMAQSFTAAPGENVEGPGDPNAARSATLPALPYAARPVGVASTIAVPLWMQGGTRVDASPRYVPQCAAAPYRPTGFLRSDAEYRRAGLYNLMSAIACEYGVPVGLFDAMIIRESRYHAAASSSRNAFGLTQLMPGTAASLGVDRYNVEENLRGGAQYLRQQLDQFGHYHLALAAYNAGPGRVRNGRVPQIAETQAYVENVLANWSRLNGLAGTANSFPRTTLPPGGRRAASVSTFRPVTSIRAGLVARFHK